MGEQVKLRAVDGHELDAYVARPEGAAKGAVVVLQEIFGVNGQIREVADDLAKEGYAAIAPALFDRYERGVELTDQGEDMKKAQALHGQLKPETALTDVAAAFAELKKEEHTGIGVVGFCFGGLMSWLAATEGEDLKMRPDGCVCYYPGSIGKYAKEEPSCPVMIHVGTADSHVGADQIEAVRAAHPEVEVYLYEGAEHAFAGTQRTAYRPEQAKLAWERTLGFLAMHLA